MVDPACVFEYQRKRIVNGHECTHSFYAIETPHGIRKFIDYNLFSETAIPVPKGYVKLQPKKERLEKYICGSKKRIVKNNNEYKKIQPMMAGADFYFILDNGGRPFLVYITTDSDNMNRVLIYRQPENMYIREADWSKNISNNRWMYIELVKEYHSSQVWIGKSPKNDSTEFSGGWGKHFDGNSILLRTTQNTFVFIGWEIYEFNMEDDDEVEEYYSAVGNNAVPYPVIWGKNNVYFMLDHHFADRASCDEMTNERERSDAYTYFYGHSGTRKITHTEKMKGFKIIQTRLWE